MENTNKRLYLIIGAVVLLVAIVGVLYIIFSQYSDRKSTQEGIKGAQDTAAAAGTSAINQEGAVITQRGTTAKNDVVPGSPEAPQQSAPLPKDSIPSKAIKLAVSAAGFSPARLEAVRGQAVTISISSSDEQTHVFAFRDTSLSAIAVGIGPQETRAISFNAPTKQGDYEFFCNVPGHAGRGETGVMTVK